MEVRRFNVRASIAVLLLSVAFATSALLDAQRADPQAVTFYKDVLPVLQNNCQSCHRPGGAAPFSLLTYETSRPWAKAIKAAVLSKKMPPWFAGPHSTAFTNHRSLSEADLKTLTAWADTGASAGDPKDAPRAVERAEGWAIGKPDVVFEPPVPIPIAARGTTEYQYVIVPTGFTEDKYIQVVEARPGDRAHTHHIVAYIRPPGSKWMEGYPVGKAFEPTNAKEGGDEQKEFFVGFAPGTLPERMLPGQAKLIRAGSDIVFQLHYTANGTPGEDRPKIGFVFAKDKPAVRVQTVAAQLDEFEIPAGARDFKLEATMKLDKDSTLVNLFPHMHVRGKSFEYQVTCPTGETETPLTVPRYDFNWQLTYDLATPRVLPKGTIVKAIAWYDNSAANPVNPDPRVAVHQGEQSWDEMLVGFFDIAYLMTGDEKARQAQLNYPSAH
jgi:mono/diheme cytochrome c family protein